MKKNIYNPFSDLWKGEQKIIAEIASLVPDNGTIVEIGTFQGGTAKILYEETHKRGVKIYTIDISPTPKAYEILKDTDVEIIAKPSLEASQMWADSIKKPVDFLFIDGSHQFKDVFEDFNAWASLLKPGGTVMFHDYDPVERGGLVHLGVKICVDAILKRNFLKKVEHKYKLLYGIVELPDRAQLDIRDCWEIFAELGKQIVYLRDTDYSGWMLVADDKFSRFLDKCLKLKECNGPIFPKEAVDKNKKYLVLAHPLGMPLDLLQAHGIPKENITVIDSFKACYLIDYASEKKIDYLNEILENRKEFWKWVETLDKINYIYGRSSFPDKVQEQKGRGLNILGLSKLITKEQIKANILASALKTLVNWTP